MRYRIKIQSFENGRKEYSAQVKKRIGWSDLDYEGDVANYECPNDTRNSALARIDLHHDGNAKKLSVEFEYINK